MDGGSRNDEKSQETWFRAHIVIRQALLVCGDKFSSPGIKSYFTLGAVDRVEDSRYPLAKQSFS